MHVIERERKVAALKILGKGLLLWGAIAGAIAVGFDVTVSKSLLCAIPMWILFLAIGRSWAKATVQEPVPLSKAGVGELRVALARLKEVVVKLPADLQEVVNALTTRALKLVNQIDADIVHDSGALKWATQQEQLRQIFAELLPPLLSTFVKVSAAGAVEEGEAAPVPSKERVFLEEQLKAIGSRLAVFEGEHRRYQEECFRTHKEALAAYLERTGPAAKELKAEEGQLLGLSPEVAMVSGSASCYDNAVVVDYGGFRQEFAGRSRDVQVGMSAQSAGRKATWEEEEEEEEDEGDNVVGVADTLEMSSESLRELEDENWQYMRYERYEKQRYEKRRPYS